MGYYLSKANKEVLDLFIPRLREAKKSFSLQFNNSYKFEYIIRNAMTLEEYRWIKDKFIVRVKEDRIHFTIRELILISEEIVEDKENINDDAMDIFAIVNDLILNKPAQVTYTNASLSLDEVSNLETWCTANNYTLTNTNETLKIKKNDPD
jgi:hypothetical protein